MLSLPWSRKCFARDAKQAGLPEDVLDQIDKALLGKLTTHAADGKLGGHSMQDEYDLHREIAYEKLGKPDVDASSDVITLAELDRAIAREDGSGWAEEYEADRPDVQWMEANADRISAEADRARLLCSFDASLGVLDLGDGMHLDFFIDADDLHNKNFDIVRARLPMLL
ncbi:MAG: hypothetical protein AAGD32_11100 [Planctomycetota bacterium]